MLNYALALLSAFLLILVFPGFGLSWLAPVALTPLLLAAAREPFAWRRFLLGEAAGIVYWFGVCYWIQFVLSYHGGMGDWAGWGAFLLFCILKALHLALFTFLAGWLMEKPYAIPAVAALWAGIERTHGTFGFAWMALGNAGIDMGLPLRLAPWVGVYGVSFLFMMLAAALAVTMRQRRRELLWLAVLPLLLLLPELPAARQAEESLVSVQPNIAMDEVWTQQSIDRHRDELAYLSIEQALKPGEKPPLLLVWPEAPAPFYYESDPRFKKAAESLARATKTHFWFGTVAYRDRDGAPLNSAQLLGPDGEPVARYDKNYLVPFGEFVPPLFGWVNKISKETGDFARGEEIVVADIDGHKVSAIICYEAVFPHLVRQFPGRGAELLVNFTNDGYFGASAARLQHLLIARMRAVENNRWLVRSTNNGITVTIDPAGRIRQALEPDVRTAARLRFNYESETTFYTRHGDWFAWLCLVAGLLAVGLSMLPVYRPER